MKMKLTLILVLSVVMVSPAASRATTMHRRSSNPIMIGENDEYEKICAISVHYHYHYDMLVPSGCALVVGEGDEEMKFPKHTGSK